MTGSRLIVLMLLLGSISGCIFPEKEAVNDLQDKVNVVTTTVPLGHFVEVIGGDNVNVYVLIEPGTNPHTFEPKPSQMKLVENADIYIKNGLGLEIWLEKMIAAKGEMLVVDSSDGVDPIEATESADEIDHADILNADPHIWLSVRNAMIMVENICDGLVEVDPANAEYYRERRDDYQEKLRLMDSQMNATFADAPQRKFLVLHPSWGYFARDYDLEQIPILITEKEPGPRYLTTIVDTALENGITTVFVDPNFNPKSAEIIAGEIGGSVVPLDPLAENYLENIQHVGKDIRASLGP